jgi:hypothetical protein
MCTRPCRAAACAGLTRRATAPTSPPWPQPWFRP